VKKSMRARIIAFYIVGLSTRTLRNALFVDSTDLIVEKTAVKTRTAKEEKADLKKVFCYFLMIPHLKRWFASKEESELLR
jgi:hypothetical protein